MLFTIQAFVEDYLRRRGLIDPDGYAVRVANLYYHHRSALKRAAFLARMRRVKTLVFLNNEIEDRAEFEEQLVGRLDLRFKKKLYNPPFPGGTERERTKLKRLPKVTITALIDEFTSAVEARAVDAFWKSRIRDKLRSKPEKLAQGLFAVFARGVLGGEGIVLRELSSGIGFVDIGVVFSRTLHLIEVKVLRSRFEGPDQLAYYMKHEQRQQGHFLMLDTRRYDSRSRIEDIICTPAGRIKVHCVDINPVPPSRLMR